MPTHSPLPSIPVFHKQLARISRIQAMEYRDIVAVLVLIFYLFVFFAAAYLIRRHGWWASYETWFVIATFAVSRLGYGAIELSTIANPDNTGLRAAAATFAVDGLAPLLFSSIGLLRRLLSDARMQGFQPALKLTHLRFLEALITASFICAAIGFSSLSKQEILDGIPEHPRTTKAAAIMYLFVTAGVALSTAIFSWQRILVPTGERKVLLGLLASQPFIFVRSTYMALDLLADIRVFSAIDGNVSAFLCMALLEEAIVTASYLAVGYTVRVFNKQQLKSVTDSLDEQKPRVTDEDLELCRTRAGSG